jgi:hypothetical protein
MRSSSSASVTSGWLFTNACFFSSMSTKKPVQKCSNNNLQSQRTFLWKYTCKPRCGMRRCSGILISYFKRLCKVVLNGRTRILIKLIFSIFSQILSPICLGGQKVICLPTSNPYHPTVKIAGTAMIWFRPLSETEVQATLFCGLFHNIFFASR